MAVERVQASSFIDTRSLGGSSSLEKGSTKADLSFGSILSRTQNQNLANSYNSAKNNNSDKMIEERKFEIDVNKSDGKDFNQDNTNAEGKGLVRSRSSVDTTKVESRIESAVARAVNEVREVIKEKLGITDEELSAVMEKLGLTMADLLKPESVMDIIMEVKGVGLADVLMDEKLVATVMEITGTQRKVTADLVEELDISTDEFKAMLDGKTINIALPDVSEEDIPEFELKLDATKDELQAVVKSDAEVPSDNIRNEVKEAAVGTDMAPAAEVKEEGSKEQTVKVIVGDDNRSKADGHLVKEKAEVISDEDKETIRTNTEVVNSSSEAAESDRQPKSGTEVINNTSDGENAGNAAEVKPEAQDAKNNDKGDGEESSGEEKDTSAPKIAAKTSANIRHFDGTRSAKTDVSETSFQQNMTDAIKEAVGNTPEANASEQLNSAARAEDIMRQITEQVKIQIKSDSTSMELELNPASLGKVGLHIEAKGGVVTAHILAQNETVKAAIESQVVTLKESMEAKGIKVQEVEVTVASHAFEHNLMGDQSSGSRFGAGDRGGNERASRLRRINLGSDGTYNDQAEAADEGEELARRIMVDNGGSLDLMA